MARAVRGVRIAAWILGGVLALLILVLALLHTPPARRWALKKTVEVLDRNGVRFEASRVGYNLAALDFTLYDVVVQSPQTPELPPLVQAGQVHLNLSLRTLLSGGYRIEDATIRNPRLHLVIDEKGRNNIPKPPEKQQQPSEAEYFADRLLIEGGSIRVEDRGRKLAAHWPLRKILVDGNPLTGNHDITLETVAGGALSLDGRTLPTAPVQANLVVEDNAAGIRRLQLGLGSTGLTLSGRIENFDDPRVNLTGSSTLHLAELARFGGLQQTFGGTLNLTMNAAGRIPEWKAEAKLSGENLTFEQFHNVDLRAGVEYDAAASRLRIASMNVESPAGALEGQADLALHAQAGESTLNAAARSLDLARITSTCEAPLRIASSADAKIAAHWPGLAFEQASGNATIALRASRQAPARDVLPVSGSIQVNTQGNRIVVTTPGLRTLNAGVQGQVVLHNRQTLGGNLRLHANDIGGTLRAAEAFLGRKIANTTVAGPLDLTADLGGTIQSPAAKAELTAPALTVGGLKQVDVRASATYTRTELGIERATLQWRNQTVTAAGTVGLGGRSPRLNLTASSADLDIQSVLAGIGRSDVPASGRIAVDAAVSGTAQNPTAELRLSGANLAAYNETLGSLEARARLENHVASLEELRLDKPQEGGNGLLRASGTFHIETKAYTFEASTSNFRLTSLALLGGTPVRGVLQVHGRGQGTVENPSAEVQLSAADLVYGTQSIGAATLRAKVANRVADLTASVPKFRLAAVARIGANQPYAATFEVRAHNTDLQTLPLHQPVQGTVSATLRGTASLSQPESVQLTAQVEAANVEWSGQPVRTEGPLLARYENKRLAIDQATLVARDSRLTLSGTLPLDATAGEGEIRLDARLDLATLSRYLPSAQPVTAQGSAAIAGTVRGTMARIDPDITVTLTGGYFSTPDLPYAVSNAELAASIRNGAVQMQNASANYGPAAVSASGTVPFGLLPANLPVELPRAQGPARLTAELRDLDLGALEGAPENLEGRLSARLDATAPRADLAAVTGTLTFPQLRVGLGPYSLEQEGVSEIRIVNGTAEVARFNLRGPETALRLSGAAGLSGARSLDLRADGKLNAAILSAFASDLRAEGETTVHLALTGTAQQPEARGVIELAGAQLSLRDPRIGAESLNLRVELAGTRATLANLTGYLNGGELSGSGSIEYANGAFRNTSLNIQATDVYLDVPANLRTISDVQLAIASGANGTLVVGGDVLIKEGGYTEDLHIGTGLLGRLSEPRQIDFTGERSPLVNSIRFNLGIRTGNPIVVDNNYATAEIEASLRLLGTPYEPGLSGRLLIVEGGEIRLQERRYAVERGVVTFTSDRRIEPNLDVLATTSVEGFDIRLQISGQPGKTETTLTSDPPLPEHNILALLLTGKTVDEMRGQEFEVARNQVLSYLAGSVGSRIGSGLASATGLSTVRIEPSLIAAEGDPSARLTVGQDITRNLELVYSMNLINSADQIYIVEYDISRRFTTRGTRQSDGSFRFDFRHDLRFGGVPAPRRGDKHEQRRIGGLTVLGEKYFNEMKIADKFGVETGDRYDFFKVRKGLDRLSRLYRDANRLESRIRLDRKESLNTVELTLRVTPSPAVDFVFEGADVPNSVRNRIRETWQNGVFDTQRAEGAVAVIREWLVKDNHLQPTIEYAIPNPSPDHKRVVFDIQPGPRFSGVELVFDGASGIEPGKLRDLIGDQKLETAVYTDPVRVTDMLTRFYREYGFLDAEVQRPQYALDPQTRTGKVVFPVKEGAQYKVGSATFAGNTVFTEEQLAAEVPLPEGEAYRPVLNQNAVQRLRTLYWDKGYNDVEIEPQIVKTAGRVDFTFRITEHRQSVVRDIVIEGRESTSESLVRTQLELAPGDILDLAKLAESRRNLYNTGAYSLIDITREEITTEGGEQVRSRQTAEATGEKPVRLRVRVREVQPYELRYGGFFDTERGPGGIVDIANRNSLGSARVLGLRARYDSQLREGRLYFQQPELRRFPFKTIVSPFVRLERNPASEGIDPFNVDRVGFTLQQESHFRRYYLFNYGYSIERSHTYDPLAEDDLFDVRLRIASLTSTFSRETRDEILDASRGSFFSQAVQFSPEILGSQVRFLKYSAQYFKYIPLQAPRVEMFTNKVERPRLVYAAGIRLGLAKGFGGQEVPQAERFFAGGSNTVRGFEQNSIGPRLGRDPLGGQAMLVINNELRVPLLSIFDGVTFLDLGNVYRRVSDIRLADIRKAGGLGLRVRTPWFLLRLDYGLKLDRQPGESRGRVFFSIGQAF